MISALLSLHLISGPLPVVVMALGAAALVALLVTRRWRRWLPVAGVVGLAGLGLGYLLCWLLGDVLDLFDVDLSFTTRTWFAVLVAGMALGIARSFRAGPRSKVLGAVVVVVAVLVGSVGINADLGEFPTVKDAVGLGGYRPLVLPARGASEPIDTWTSPAHMPQNGRVGTVTIPATSSHFAARPAIVYLPPAALVARPAKLPVLVMLSGQPGAPSDLFTSGALASALDSYAHSHDGLAPIVVVPDQLGQETANPMCVDGALGNSATYVTRDVAAWVHAHLTALSGPADRGIGGFSQGGTCSIQLGAAHPSLYGSIVDISGQVAPKRGTVQQTIDAGFAGSRSAYEAALPAAILARSAPYTNSFALFAVGSGDQRYGPGLRQVAAEASAAGMTTHLYVSPGTAHDWHTVRYSLAKMIPAISEHWGLISHG
ncbi:alpha/beta hydrolase [Lacisediminihabitans changchengi]|uniref:Esterase n=1 Tax=Lacisediminihabitans changchengi TaxID=2787634 RepID=A0A934SJ94_9MICO|nr:alpha/beta hydrolase-fold protein [Lacisediminihabitans changchengi]MBK4346603.1 hypothetical protein [Lacisediminihabitans changchengi]